MRENINVDSSNKLFESFMDFSGGLNSETSNEKLKNNEMPRLQNVDLDGMGSVKSRTGRVKIGEVEGLAQGMFFYYKLGAYSPDIILAISGKLYLTNGTEIVIKDYDDAPFIFQQTLPIEGVQYRATMYIATGTKLVELYNDGEFWSAKVAVPYTPTVMEAIYIGTNGLADDPDSYIQDGTGLSLSVQGIKPDVQSGAVNDPVSFTAFLNRRIGYSGLHDYKWEYKRTAETSYTLAQDYKTADNNTGISFTAAGAFDVKVTVRETAPSTSNIVSLASIISSTGTGSSVADGTALTKWSTPTLPGWVRFDMGDSYNITKWLVRHASSDGSSDPLLNTRDFKLEVSNDGITYTAADTVTGNTAAVTDRAVTTAGRYIRVYVTLGADATQTNAISIAEIELYGTPTVTPPEASFVLAAYQVNLTNVHTVNPSEGTQLCRHIILHWDRLIMYGDPLHPYQLHISDLENPYYFPVTNTVNFDTGKQEPITAATRFQDILVVFTKTTIQTLTGKSPEDYARYHIHDGMGALAPRSVKVVGNNIMFLSHEGVQMLKPNPYRLEALNVGRTDRNVQSELPKGEDEACAVVSGSQYWLCFPDSKLIYRFYYEMGSWVKDTSSKLDFIQFLQYGDQVYNLSTDGKVYKHDSTVYKDDDEAPLVVVESKQLDFSAAFNKKKLKKLFVLARNYDTHHVHFKVYVKADSAIALTSDSGEAVLNETTGYVEWVAHSVPNMHFYSGTTFGSWLLGESPLGETYLSVQFASIRGKCRRTKIIFVYDGGEACEIFGYGFQFGLKRP